MSAFTDKLKSFFSNFAEVSHEELAKVETAVEEKVRPIVAEARDEIKQDVTRLEEQLKALEAKVEQTINAGPAAS
jgi:polyhydroxyalkanoate synthesis regulator phasin